MELILVMALVTLLLGFVAPTMRNSFKQRSLDQEALRLLSVTEYAREEAVSQGIPTQVWLDQQSGSYGAEAVPGYEGDKMDTSLTSQTAQNTPTTGVLTKEYVLPPELHFDAARTSNATAEGHMQMIQFDPDGSPTASTGITYVHIVNQDNATSTLTLSTDGWGYEITKGNANGTGAQ